MPKSTTVDPFGTRHDPTADPSTAEGRAIYDLYRRIRRIDDPDDWNELVSRYAEELLKDFGFGVNLHPAVGHAIAVLRGRGIKATVETSDARGRVMVVRAAGGRILIGASEDIPDNNRIEEVDGWAAQYYPDDESDPVVVYPVTEGIDPQPMAKAVAEFAFALEEGTGV